MDIKLVRFQLPEFLKKFEKKVLTNKVPHGILHNVNRNNTNESEEKAMISIKIFRNKENTSKFLEVHNDFNGHWTVRQYMYGFNYNKNYTGDKKLHRIRKAQLTELLKDYDFVSSEWKSRFGTVGTIWNSTDKW